MPNLNVNLSDAEFFALDLIAVDKQKWAENFLKDRARVAVEQLAARPEWGKALAGLAAKGGDATDKSAVLLKGKEMGLFLTAAQVAAAQKSGVDVLPTPKARDPLKTPLNRVQLFAILRLRFNKTAKDLVALAEKHITDEAKKSLTISKIDNAQKFDRDDPLFVLFAKLIDVTPEQIDAAWVEGLKIAV